MTEGRRWLAEALAASEGVAPGRARARRTSPPASRRSGRATTRRRSRSSNESLELAREAGDDAPRGAGAPADRLARDDARQATRRTTASGRASWPGGRSSSRARSATSSSSRARSTSSPSSRPRRATRRPRTSSTSRASALRRELGDKRLIANSVLTLGRAELTRGDYERATRAPPGGLRARARARRHVEHVARAHEPRPRRAAQRRRRRRGREALRRRAQAREGARRQARRRRMPAGARRPSSAPAATSAQAARLFGACDALLESIGATPTPIEVALNEQFVPPVQREPRRRALHRRVGRRPRRAARRGDRAALSPPARLGPRRRRSARRRSRFAERRRR